MKKVKIIFLTVVLTLIFAETVNAAPIYSGTCQDAGLNDNGQNVLTSCSSGQLSDTECTFISKGMGVIHLICADARYIYHCGSLYNGNWYKVGQNTYKCST